MAWIGWAVFVSALLHVVTGQGVIITSVRLAGGNSTAGRVEVEINGTFGTVCDDLWQDVDASVVCKQLGLTGGKALSKAAYGQGTGSILLDDVDCKGNENTLSGCYFTTGVNNCEHSEDASVECGPAGAPTTPSPQPTTTLGGVNQKDNCKEGVNPQATVRLFGPASQTGVGYVQVQEPNGQYGYVCDDGWDVNAAKVVCKELCYQQALAESTIPKDFQVGVMAPRIILDDVKCTGTENRLSECQHAPWNQHNCKDTELAAVTCVPVEYPTPTHNGSLLNGTTPEPEPPATDQPTAPSPKLQCRNGDLIALFNKSRDPNLEPKHLSLDTSCADLAKDDTDPSFITVTIPFDKCGTSATQNQTHIIYTNTIIVEPTSREGAITRVNEYRVVLICEMPRNATVDRDVQPLTETVTQRSQGEFVVTMNIYQNRSFQNPATVYPFQLTLGEWLNAAVELEAIDSKLKLVVTDCTASPNMSDPASPSINLLQDKCVADRATLEMHPLSQVKMGMRLQSFSFVNYPLVVIQCNTIVCLTSEVTAECDRSCNNSKPAPAASGGTGRRRRDVSGSEGSGSRWRRDVSKGAGGGAAGSKTVYTVRSLPVVLVVQPRSPPTNSTTPSTTTTTTTTTTTSTPTSTSTSITPSTTSSSKSTTTTTTTSTSAKNPTTSAPTTAKNTTTTTTTERGETSERASTPTPPTPIPSPTTTATPILITVRGTGKPLITPSTSARRGLVVMEGEGKSGAPCRKSSASAAMLVFLVLVAVAVCREVSVR